VDIRAEMVAQVHSVLVSTGAVIAEGETLVILESMKMEIPVLAESSGTVTEIAVSPGDVVHEGDLIAIVI
jgi:acetyl-CoA carboxylase biotin carboxyl carrier protein